jgi:hypothetical protein
MGGDLVPVYYITGTAASIAAVLGGARAYYSRQRKRWTDEGARVQRSTEALDSNTDAARANTDAIQKLSARIDTFAEETRRQLNGHDMRLQRLEDLPGNDRRSR